MDIFEEWKNLENDCLLIRLLKEEDLESLFTVYSDSDAFPFFNSDNCDDNFFYDTLDKMKKAMDFWFIANKNGWFVRLAIVDKKKNLAIGTFEIFKREEEMTFMRMDLRSDYENKVLINNLLSLVEIPFMDLFKTKSIMTKEFDSIPRMEALKENGYQLDRDFILLGKDGKEYKSYYRKWK